VRLTEAAGVAGFDVVRDGDFATLGLLSHRLPGMLVCAWEPGALGRELPSNPAIACVVATPALAPEVPSRCGLAVAADPVRSFFDLHAHLCRGGFYGADEPTVVSPEARIHPAATVAPRNVRIGRGAVVEAGARVLERSRVGEDVVLRAGCVIGAEGFHPKVVAGRLRLLPHGGGVALADRVEVQSNAVVCRALFRGDTTIGEDTKISSLVNVSHHARIGRRCRIGAGAVITGSVEIGDDVWIGPHATLRNRIRIGDGAAVSLGAVVVRDVLPGRRVSGNFALDHRAFLAAWRSARRRGARLADAPEGGADRPDD
jgi:UDP-3-O-[3-hydroxymyristoyl] glucosamine N-acyltransferase